MTKNGNTENKLTNMQPRPKASSVPTSASKTVATKNGVKKPVKSFSDLQQDPKAILEAKYRQTVDDMSYKVLAMDRQLAVIVNQIQDLYKSLDSVAQLSVLNCDLAHSTKDYIDNVLVPEMANIKHSKFSAQTNKKTTANRNTSDSNVAGYSQGSDASELIHKATPKDVLSELDKHIIGQDELKTKVAMFYYYHLMRLENKDLPASPLLIAGPSGCGKTETFRVLQKMYPEEKIVIVNSGMITQDGWKGNFKFADVFKQFDLEQGRPHGIIVFDEFDKRIVPQYESHGTNTSFVIQTEILKAVEGDGFCVDNEIIDTSGFDFVFIGAFSSLFDEKAKPQICIGFETGVSQTVMDVDLTEEDFIRFGMSPELMGRISNYVVANKLTKDDFKRIIDNPNGRIAKLRKSMKKYVDCAEIDSQVDSLIDDAVSNNTGVRSVIIKLEQQLISNIMNIDKAIGVTDEGKYEIDEQLDNEKDNNNSPDIA